MYGLSPERCFWLSLSFNLVRFNLFYSFLSVAHIHTHTGPFITLLFCCFSGRTIDIYFSIQHIIIIMILCCDIFSLCLMYKLHFILVAQIRLSHVFGTRLFILYIHIHIHVYYYFSCSESWIICNRRSSFPLAKKYCWFGGLEHLS